MPRVLGIDLASGEWRDNGTALVIWGEHRFLEVQPGCIDWPAATLTPERLAQRVVAFCEKEGVSAVSLDGPQGWRDPLTDPALPGVGRRCEYESRTQGKTGWLRTYPSNQRGWIEFCIAVFDHLLRAPGVQLASTHEPARQDRLMVLECFPTSTWRTAGLEPLPGKKSRPDLREWMARLQGVFRLPAFTTGSHDDLQAVVGALPAAGLLGGPVDVFARGQTARLHQGRRIEGFIWDASPKNAGDRLKCSLGRRSGGMASPGRSHQRTESQTGVCVRVTSRVLAQVNATGDTRQAQIAVRGLSPASKFNRIARKLRLAGASFTLIQGDHSAFWPSHQAGSTDFDRLFALLADSPDEFVAVEVQSE